MQPRTKFLICLVSFTVAIRLLPYFLTSIDHTNNPYAIFYPWNFIPLTAFCLYSGGYVTDRRWSMAWPLMALLFSDLGIWAVKGDLAWAFPSDRWTAYVCCLISVLMGIGLNRRSWPLRAVDVLGRGILAEALFFVVSNLAFFVSQTDPPYTFAGLVACFVAAIPFAGKSFASTAFYSVLLVSPLAISASCESGEAVSERRSTPAA